MYIISSVTEKVFMIHDSCLLVLRIIFNSLLHDKEMHLKKDYAQVLAVIKNQKIART